MSKINLEHEIINDEYTEYVYSTFDIQDSDKTSTEIIFDLSEMNESDWNIGIILGSSGSGKSSILRSIGNIPDVKFDTNKALISNFNFLDPKEATFALTSVGLSSVPTWLRPFHLLSNGEQYRAKLAYLIASFNMLQSSSPTGKCHPSIICFPLDINIYICFMKRVQCCGSNH